MINRVRVEVYGSRYTIATPETEGYVQDLADTLNEQIKNLLDGNPKLSFNDALVLCSINYIDAFKKSEQAADHMRGQLTDYLEDAARARIELDEARREMDKLKRRLEVLEKN